MDREDEINRNRQKQMDDGTYTDDGNIPVSCPYCGTERPIISVADCCERAREEQDKSIRDVAEAMAPFWRID